MVTTMSAVATILIFVIVAFQGSVLGATGPGMVSGGSQSEPGLDYQKLLAKLEILDTKITRVEAASREQFSSFESKLDRIIRQVENVSATVHNVRGDVGGIRAEIQHFKNASHEQLDALAGSVTIIQSLLVEGHNHFKRQKLAHPAADAVTKVNWTADSSMPLLQTTAPLQVYESCDLAPKSISTSVVHQLLPEPGFGDSFPVVCDQQYESGGWVVIQSRFNGSVDFYRGWKEYKNGFGNLKAEFWLGLDRIHQLTYSAPYELHVLLEDFENKTVVAKYSRFAVGNEHESYAITKLGEYNGTAGDGLGYHRGSKFSTMDINHDVPGNNGGVDWTGAWWYRRGHHSNLNGQYLKGPVDASKYHGKGMTWNPFRGDNYSLKRSRMMIKRVMNF
ncbi:fibrinogen C domain-containing protein 1 [Culex quinquefasciatus]|uniref:Fibrinogen C domain-containing protein 1 n=1 Tax=Culex pipiens TaxID=7175 RepID=A0A8D8JZ07_CULPI|nr:fibrinogen C domain-containing protein 1 [Culex quinquefasciatus]